MVDEDDDSMKDDDDDYDDEEEQFDIPDNTKRISSIQLGQIDIDCWYHSPYINADDSSNAKNRTIEKLYICEYCLRYFFQNKNYRQHTNECNRRQPPGRKIYEDLNGISVYEIDGKTSELYCQCLCLLAKLFLERKTIYFDVSPFLFYVLVEADTRIKNIQHIIGYFSKEKQSDESYNLACLMVLPHRQRQGFGRFLISLSYELTKLEKKTGSPEKPLSALGQMTYKNYWRSAIIAKLNEYCHSHIHATVLQLSTDTGICIEDVVQTLIDLQFAHTGAVAIETQAKQQEGRGQRQRRRQKSQNENDQYDDNNSILCPTSILAINEDLLYAASTRMSSENVSSTQNQHVFDQKYLRLITRR